MAEIDELTNDLAIYKHWMYNNVIYDENHYLWPHIIDRFNTLSNELELVKEIYGY
jgi:hypothetical protein